MIKLVTLLFMPCACSAGCFLDNPDIGNNSYLNARYLNHTTGRFLTQDDKKQFKSHYLYGNGDVIKKSDPSGNMFGDLFNSLGSVSAVETRSAMDILTRESTTIVVPDGGTIDTHMVVRDSNNVIISRRQIGRVDNTLPPSYDSLYGEEENNSLLTSRYMMREAPPNYDSIFHGSLIETSRQRTRRVRSNLPTPRIPLRIAENETEMERTERLLREFENSVGIFSENPLPPPRHHNYYNGVTSPYGDSLEYTLFDFLNNIPNYDSPVDSD